jgi:hypothetical protein
LTLKTKTDKKLNKSKKKKIKAKSFKGMEKLREQSKFESEDSTQNKRQRSKKKKISFNKSRNQGVQSPFKEPFTKGTLVESETLHSGESDNILIRGMTNKKSENSRNSNNLIVLNTQEKLEANPEHRLRVTAEYYNNDKQGARDNTSNYGGGNRSKKVKTNKNDFVDKALIEKLRNEPSSDEEDIMEGVYSKDSNLINGINSVLLKKSIQPKHQKDNTVINLNYSGDSDGFIDGNISEKHISDDDNTEMKDYLINGSKVKTESSQAFMNDTKGKGLGYKNFKEDDLIRPKNDSLMNQEELVKIVSGLKNQLSIMESNGGLTGLKNQNKDAGKVYFI